MIRFIYFCAAFLLLTIAGTGALYMMDGIKAERSTIAARDVKNAQDTTLAAINDDVSADMGDDAAAALNAIETAAGADAPAAEENSGFGAPFTNEAPPALQDGKSSMPMADNTAALITAE